MYEDLANKYTQWSCSVGGGTPQIKGSVYGMGCVLDEFHILTAYHCWSSISEKYDWPVVLRLEGIFRCEIIFKSIPDDIAVLRCIERIDDRERGTFKEFPKFSSKPLFVGSSVGFISRLTIHDSPDSSTSHNHFANGTVSMIIPNEDDTGIQYTISSTVVQKGFSGSAVFRVDGKIVGVVVQMLNVAADITDPNSQIFVLPVISPIVLLIKEISSAITINSINA